MSEQYWLPDFELAELTTFDPRVFDSSRPKLDRFVLMLALVYNDFKVLNWIAYQMKKGKANKTGSEVDGYLGQVVGFEEWTNRQNISLLHELLVLIHHSADRLKDPFLGKCVAAVPAKARGAWTQVVKASQGAAGNSPLGKYLARIRSNVAYHYYQPKELMAGYRRHFFEEAPAPHNRFLFASIGAQMETTRFYFADGAAQAYCRKVIDGGGQLFEQAGRHLRSVNLALRFVLEQYLRQRAAEVASAHNSKTAKV